MSCALAAVVAVLAGLLGTSLGPRDWLCVTAVGAGLVLVAASAGPEQPAPMAAAGRWALLATPVVVVLAAAELTRRPAARPAATRPD